MVVPQTAGSLRPAGGPGANCYVRYAKVSGGRALRQGAPPFRKILVEARPRRHVPSHGHPRSAKVRGTWRAGHFGAGVPTSAIGGQRRCRTVSEDPSAVLDAAVD